MNCFALLDDYSSTPPCQSSRLYTGFLCELRCDDPAQLSTVWVAVAKAQRDGYHAVVMADYEWGMRLLGLPSPHGDGCLRVLMFTHLQKLDATGVDAWLERAGAELCAPQEAAGVLNVRATVDETAFESAIQHIHKAIRDGETYQVNYSYRLDFATCGDPLLLYRQLRQRQPVGYGALIALPAGGDHEYVLSFSPELLIRNIDGVLTAQPMKGTAARTGDALVDARAVASLAGEKCRAENVMIVDLLRNDLGRIAEVGSVKVPQLFSVETYPSVFQMTSTVTAQLRDDCGFSDVLRAVFPCGSVTGAPKHHTMELIAALESDARGLYCGTIGWIDVPKNGRACGDFCLSVAIRTLCMGLASEGFRAGRLGIGAGIVADSDAVDERAECEMKAQFLVGIGAGFSLLETMYATRDGGIRHRERHLARLASSAASLGFVFPQAELLTRLDDAIEHLPEAQPYRVRLSLAERGGVEISISPLDSPPTEPVRLLLASVPLDTDQLILRHKTTLRCHYEGALRFAEQQGAFDMLFFNQRGELTEGARSNVFVRIDGEWRTPALHCGVLPGIMRGLMLEDAALHASECVVTPADLHRADEILVCNALRGVLQATLDA